MLAIARAGPMDNRTSMMKAAGMATFSMPAPAALPEAIVQRGLDAGLQMGGN